MIQLTSSGPHGIECKNILSVYSTLLRKDNRTSFNMQLVDIQSLYDIEVNKIHFM